VRSPAHRLDPFLFHHPLFYFPSLLEHFGFTRSLPYLSRVYLPYMSLLSNFLQHLPGLRRRLGHPPALLEYHLIRIPTLASHALNDNPRSFSTSVGIATWMDRTERVLPVKWGTATETVEAVVVEPSHH